MVYILAIQLCLISQFFLMVFCECTTFFADTLKSILTRWVMGISLVIVAYYANYLILAPYHVIVAVFFCSVISTFLAFKFIGKEYLNRLQISNRLILLNKYKQGIKR